MAEKITSHKLHGDQEVAQDHRNPSSSPSADDFFEFFKLSDYSEEKIMSHAEDIIFCGKLIPINEQLPRQKPPQHQHDYSRRWRRSRFEIRSDVKCTTPGALVVRNSRSVDYKRLRHNSSMSSEPTAEINCEGSAAGSGKKKSTSSRWHVRLSGLVNMPQTEMNIRDLKDRQVRLTTSKTSNIGSSEPLDVFSVSGRSFDHRRYSWRILELLSCKCSSAAVTTPLSYMTKV